MGALSAYCPTLSIWLYKLPASINKPEFRQRYATRAGVEGSIIFVLFIVGARAIGLAKTQLQHIITASHEPSAIRKLVESGTQSMHTCSRFAALKPAVPKRNARANLIFANSRHELRAPAPMKMW